MPLLVLLLIGGLDSALATFPSGLVDPAWNWSVPDAQTAEMCNLAIDDDELSMIPLKRTERIP